MVSSSISSFFNNVGFQLKKHSPEILTGLGVAGYAGATVLACVATVKVVKVIEEAKEELDGIDESVNDPNSSYSEEDAKADRKKVYLHSAGCIAKHYAPAVGLSIASAASIFYANGVLNKRNAGLAASLASSTLGLKEYRRRVIEKFGDDGKELDKAFRYGLKEEEIKEEIVDENGKKKIVKKKVKTIDSNSKVKNVSYIRRFDWTNPYYKEDINYILFFLRSQQNYFNDKLRAYPKNGHIWMNSVDTALGFKETEEGQIVGWRYDPDDPYIDNFIDFNLCEAYAEDEYGIKRPVVMIEYNVDGSILNKIKWDEED